MFLEGEGFEKLHLLQGGLTRLANVLLLHRVSYCITGNCVQIIFAIERKSYSNDRKDSSDEENNELNAKFSKLAGFLDPYLSLAPFLWLKG